MLAIHTPTHNKITTKLVAIFLDSTGKKHQWTYADVDPSLSPAQLRTYCEQIAQLDLFEKDGILLFTKLVRAKLVTTIETPIFELKDTPDQNFPADPSPTNSLSNTDIQINESPIRSLVERMLTTITRITKRRKYRLPASGFT